METFSYKAPNTAGREDKGTIQAESRDDAIKKLKERNLVPTAVQAQSALDKDLSIPFLSQAKKAKPRDLAVFCRQFASVLRAGVPVVNALEMMRDQTTNKDLAAAIARCQSSVEKGETLADAMKHEEIMPSILVDMVKAGEASGSLENALVRMAIQFEKTAKLNGIIKKALMYPIILMIVAVAVIIVMLTFVIPQFKSMFDDLDSDLPGITKFMLAASDSLQHMWWLYVIVVVAIVVAYKLFAASEGGRKTLDTIKLKIPGFGSMNVKSACANLSRTLSTLLNAGMPMIDALDIAGSTMNNVIYRDAMEKVKSGVSLGMQLSKQIAATEVFTPMLVNMIGIGEETGNVEEMLDNIAGYYEEEVENATQALTSMMEPLIIVVMAFIVVFILLSIYLPMIQLYNTLG